MKRLRNIMGIIMYILAIVSIILYIILSNMTNFLISPMLRLILLLLSCILMYLGARITKSSKLMRINIWLWFILYVVLILTLTLFDNYYARGYFHINDWNKKFLDIYLKESFNIIPFKTIFEYTKAISNSGLKYFILNIGGNIIAFMPFAFFLPRLIKKENKALFFTITVALLSLIIEITQFATLSGVCDIDDIILNTLGAVILFKILNISQVKHFIDHIFLENKNVE